MNKQRRQAYQAIKEVCQNHYGWINILLKYIGVSRQAYHKFHTHPETEFEKRNKQLKKELLIVFEEHNKSIGASKILSNLNHKKVLNFKATIKQVKRIMRELKIKCIVREKKKARKKIEEQYIRDNILNQDFTASKPNEVWLSDSTQLEYGKTQKKSVRLSGILDLYGRYLVGYKITESETAEAETSMFREAFDKVGNVHPLVHTDRGSAYVSNKFSNLLMEKQIVRSMSRPGTPFDNSPMEHWWSEFKLRWINIHPTPESKEELEKLVFEGIEYFNKKDRSEARNDLTPAEYWNEAISD